MGIPHFYKYVLTKHRQVIRGSLPRPCDYLMLDLNCAVHRCAEGVSKVISNQPMEGAVIDAVMRWIGEVVALCTPRTELFIALDGVPPRAKMVQQRSRRFISSLTSQKGAWDSCCVTPGTKFMSLLSSRLHAFADSSKLLPVVVSDSSVAGEGEHKIFERIVDRACGEGVGPVVIYGADADLIMLSLRSPAATPFVLREDQTMNDGRMNFQYIDIRDLRQRLPMPPAEFVVLSMLLGNDFVPPLSFLRVRERGVDYLLEKYKIAGSNLISRDGSLDMAAFSALLALIAADEDSGLKTLDDGWTAARERRFGGPFSGQDAWARSIESPDVQRIRPGTPGWRGRYYSVLFPLSDDRNEVTARYIEGIVWTFAYYFNYSASKTKVSDWYYPYAFSPTLIDVVNYLATPHVIDIEKAGPVTSAAIKDNTLQLLLVLPTTSKGLIQGPGLSDIMTSIEEGCLHFYPTRFMLATYLKWHVSDSLAILPDIDGNQILAAMQRIKRREKRALKL